MNLEELLPLMFDKPKKTKKNRGNRKLYLTELTYKGKTQSIYEWSKEIKLDPKTIRRRYHDGLPIEKILYPGKLSAARKQTNSPWSFKNINGK